jgi:glucose/arabinose dehydrogenase
MASATLAPVRRPRRAAVLLAVLIPLAAGLAACDLPPGFSDEVVFSGLDLPTAVDLSPDGRVFVAEKRGTVRVFDGVGDPSPTLVADLRTQVYSSWDRGLLGLALHPAFPATPWLYVAYTLDAAPGGSVPRWGQGTDVDPCPSPPGATEDGCVVGGRVSRLTIGSGGTMTGSEVVLVEDWCQQYPSHSMGDLEFGPDGALYVSAGEGASFNWADYGQTGIPRNPCGDPGQQPNGQMSPPAAEGGALRSQDLLTSGDPTGLGGTVIRIDPATGAALPSNPLAGSSDPGARRIVAFGLRNPFRFAVRPGTTELWIGDVGWNAWEEVDVTVGADATVDNFGWPCLEGGEPTDGYAWLGLRMCDDLLAAGTAKGPVFRYRRGQPVAGDTCPTDRGSSISGMAFVEAGGPYPAFYDDALFFADATRGCIFVMRPGPDGRPDPAKVSRFARVGSPVDLAIGPGGELWYVDLYQGAVRRIGYTPQNTPPQAAFSVDPASGSPPLTVTFDGRASSDPDAGDTLTYAWDLDGDGAHDDGSGPVVSTTYTTVGTRTVRLRVTDAAGASDTAEQLVRVGTVEPVVTIHTPTAGTPAVIGSTLAFSGGATVDGTALPPSALSWTLDLLHCPVSGCHRHPDVFRLDGAASGSVVVPDHELPAQVELRLTASWLGDVVVATRVLDLQPA